jgi:hypothetical protein
MNMIKTLRVLFPAVWNVRLHWVQFAALGLQAASTGLSLYGSSQAKKKAKDQVRQDAALTRAATETQIETITASKTEAENKSVQAMSKMARQAMIERGRILAGAGEAGVAGGSVAGALLQTFQYEAENRGEELYNLAAYKRQANREITSAEAGLQVNLPQYRDTGPSPFATILAGATNALTSYHSMTAK